LRVNEFTQEFQGYSIKSYDSNQLASNSPIEDTRAEARCLLTQGKNYEKNIQIFFDRLCFLQVYFTHSALQNFSMCDLKNKFLKNYQDKILFIDFYLFHTKKFERKYHHNVTQNKTKFFAGALNVGSFRVCKYKSDQQTL
jgi:hypothetical protein